MSKSTLIKIIMKMLKKMPKKSLALFIYNSEKYKLPTLTTVHVLEKRMEAKLPRLRTTKRKALSRMPRRTKRKIKFSPKQLAAQRLFAKRAKAGTLRRTKFKRKYGRLMS